MTRLDLRYVVGWNFWKLLWHCPQRAVVDRQQMTAQCVLAEDGIELLDKKLGGRPIVENRHQNRQLKQR